MEMAVALRSPATPFDASGNGQLWHRTYALLLCNPTLRPVALSHIHGLLSEHSKLSTYGGQRQTGIFASMFYVDGTTGSYAPEKKNRSILFFSPEKKRI